MMRNIESIYLSKLERFQSVLERGAAKQGGSVFAGILSEVKMRINGPISAQPVEVADANPQHIDAALTYVDAASSSKTQIDRAIENAAQQTGLSPALIRAVIMTESSFRPKAVSRCGAQGLMQLMPRTAKELGVKDSFDVFQNVLGGCKYLKKQLNRFGDLRLALAAYNAGPARVASYKIKNPDDPKQYERLSKGVRGYVNKILKYYKKYSAM